MSSVPPKRSVTLIMSDSLLRDIRFEPSSPEGLQTVFSFVKRGGKYQNRNEGPTHEVAEGWGESVIQLVFGGWDPVKEGLSPEHLEIMTRALGDVSKSEVSRVVLVLGINSVRGFINERSQPLSDKVLGERKGKTITAVAQVAFQLLARFPQADVVYLGTGRVWMTPPRNGPFSSLDPRVLTGINDALSGVGPGVDALFRGFDEGWEQWSQGAPGHQRAKPTGKLLFDGSAWVEWESGLTVDQHGHFSKKGSQEAVRRMTKALRVIYPSPPSPRLPNSELRGVQVRDSPEPFPSPSPEPEPLETGDVELVDLTDE
jgi:hypothetical protein